MSDTTKIDKVRVNGVLYDLAGSGSGGVSGAYLAPKTLISPEYTGFSQATINPIALIEQLEKAGIPVDDDVLDPSEYEVDLGIGYVYSNNNGDVFKMGLIDFLIYRGESGRMVVVDVMGDYHVEGEVPDEKTTLREIINYFFSEEMYSDFNFNLDYNYGYLENFINIYYDVADETLHYYISNMTEFCEEVIIEYHSGSDSSN